MTSASASVYKKNEVTGESFNNSLRYCIDLGLLKLDDNLRSANRINAISIMRQLNENIPARFSNDLSGAWMEKNKIYMNELLKEFQK
jgi:hypothetical protein